MSDYDDAKHAAFGCREVPTYAGHEALIDARGLASALIDGKLHGRSELAHKSALRAAVRLAEWVSHQPSERRDGLAPIGGIIDELNAMVVDDNE